jgi:hypothetical protein
LAAEAGGHEEPSNEGTFEVPVGDVDAQFARQPGAAHRSAALTAARSTTKASNSRRLATALFAGKLLKPLDFDRLCAEIAAALDNRT